MTTDQSKVTPPDDGLRRMLKWVFAALALTVLFAVIVVALTIRCLS